MSTTKILLILLLVLTYFSFLNGMKFFPGKGCGTTTPINILDKIPLDTSNLECVIVNEEMQVEKEKEKKDVYATSETRYFRC